jgi:hypothetical protein
MYTAIEASDAGACDKVNATVEASPLKESEMEFVVTQGFPIILMVLLAS